MRGCGVRGVPCHRVVAAAGRLGGYGGYSGLKRDLLRAEGIRVVGSSIRDFRTRRFPLRGAPAGRTLPAPTERKVAGGSKGPEPRKHKGAKLR